MVSQLGLAYIKSNKQQQIDSPKKATVPYLGQLYKKLVQATTNKQPHHHS